MNAGEAWNRIWLSIFFGGSMVIVTVGLIMYRCRVKVRQQGRKVTRTMDLVYYRGNNRLVRLALISAAWLLRFSGEGLRTTRCRVCSSTGMFIVKLRIPVPATSLWRQIEHQPKRIEVRTAARILSGV